MSFNESNATAFYQVPKNCGECIYLKTGFFDYSICNYPTDKDREILDISAFKVSSNTKPDWCPIEKTKLTIKQLSPEDKERLNKVMNGFQALFELINKKGALKK